MNVYKLKYLNKEIALADLLDKKMYLLQEDEKENYLIYGEGVQAIVEIGTVVIKEGVYDEKGNLEIAPIYAEGYHYDVMCEQDVDFGVFEVSVKHPKHSFSGYNSSSEIVNEIV